MAHFVEDFGKMRISYDQEISLHEYITFPRGFSANDFSEHLLSTIRFMCNQYIHTIHGTSVTCDITVQVPNPSMGNPTHTLSFRINHQEIGNFGSPVLIYIDDEAFTSAETASQSLFARFTGVLAVLGRTTPESLINKEFEN